MLENISSIDYSTKLNKNEFQNSTFFSDNYDKSIFSSASEDSDYTENENTELLNEKLDSVESENGIFLKTWNNIKEMIGIGTSADKCEEAVLKYENGEITYEEAMQTIDEYDAKQESSLNLFSNIATSIVSIGAVAAVTVLTGGIGTPAAIAIGAATGAAAKTGFKLTDRATNEVEGDALDGKQIAKDALSGAITGGTAVATMGTSGNAASIAEAAKTSAKTGVITGAVSGSSNYLIDCTFDEDKEFNTKDFIVNTAENAVVGGIVGGTMGSVNGFLRSSGILNSGCNLETMVSSTENASVENVTANSICSASYKLLNNKITSAMT